MQYKKMTFYHLFIHSLFLLFIYILEEIYLVTLYIFLSQE